MSFRDRIQAKALEQQPVCPKGIGFRPELTELGIEDKWQEVAHVEGPEASGLKRDYVTNWRRRFNRGLMQPTAEGAG